MRTRVFAVRTALAATAFGPGATRVCADAVLLADTRMIQGEAIAIDKSGMLPGEIASFAASTPNFGGAWMQTETRTVSLPDGSAQAIAGAGQSSVFAQGGASFALFAANGTAGGFGSAFNNYPFGGIGAARATASSTVLLSFRLDEPHTYDLEGLLSIEDNGYNFNTVSVGLSGPGVSISEAIVGGAGPQSRGVVYSGALSAGLYSLVMEAHGDVRVGIQDGFQSGDGSFDLSLELTPVPAPGSGVLALLGLTISSRRRSSHFTAR